MSRAGPRTNVSHRPEINTQETRAAAHTSTLAASRGLPPDSWGVRRSRPWSSGVNDAIVLPVPSGPVSCLQLMDASTCFHHVSMQTQRVGGLGWVFFFFFFFYHFLTHFWPPGGVFLGCRRKQAHSRNSGLFSCDAGGERAQVALAPAESDVCCVCHC